ncbi:MAG: Uma2 family endonuclease [Thermomicrobiales bacterium]|nr:Uma2 family endonuclease [Thermomicrobiales bacterium]
MVTSTQLVTADELLTMGSDAPFELWEGVLKEVSPSGSKPSVIGARLQIFIGQFVLERDLGFTTNADGGYVLDSILHTVVAPDVGFYRSDRYPGGVPDQGFYPMPPDLAVEVISPTDRRTDISRKQELYTRAGVPLVWWVDPENRSVTICRPGKEPEVLDESGVLDGGDVLSGFTLALDRLFALR